MNAQTNIEGAEPAVSSNMADPTRKAHFWKTARALVSCARFKAGEFVAVRYWFTAVNGVNWYVINRTQNGPCPDVAYPEHLLSEFCI